MPSIIPGKITKNTGENNKHNKFLGEQIKTSLKRLGFIFATLFVVCFASFYLLMANINLIHPYLEDSLSLSLHRQVKLDTLSCRLGLNGLTLSSNKMTVSDNHLNKNVFIKSGPVDLSIAFLPLLRGKLIIKHIDLNSPQFWVYKIGPNYWNFSDLLVDGPEIRFIQIENGKLHVDQYDSHYRKSIPISNFERISLKLVMPKRQTQWPFYLYFQIPNKNTHDPHAWVRLNVMGYGYFKEWQTNKYKFTLETKNIRSSYLKPFIVNLPSRLDNKLITMQASGEGTYKKGIKGIIKSQINALDYIATAKAPPSSHQVNANASFLIDANNMTWSDLKIRTANAQSIFSDFLPNVKNKALFSSLFDFDKETNIKSNISINSGKIDIHKLEIPFQNTSLNINGYLVNTDKEAHIKFFANDLEIKNTNTDWLPQNLFGKSMTLKSLRFSGQASLTGQLDIIDKKETTTIETVLKDALIYNDNKIIAEHVSGGLTYKDNYISLNNIQGQLPGTTKSKPGNFRINGSIQTGTHNKCNLVLTGTHVDLKQLIDIAHSYQIQLPKITNSISGRAANITCNVTNNLDKPSISINLSPEDIRLVSHSPNKNTSLKLSAGTIAITNNDMSLKDVNIIGNSGKLIANGSFTNINSNIQVKWAKISCDEIDIAEVNNYVLSSPYLKETFSFYTNLLNKYNLSLLRGKLYGSISWQKKTHNPSIDGSLGVYNLAGKIGNNQLPFYRTLALLNFKNQDVDIQDSRVSLGKSRFAITGHISDLFGKQAITTNIKGQVFPQDLTNLLPELASVYKMEIFSNKPLFIKANITNDKQTKNIESTLKIIANSNFKIKFGKWGTIYQPAPQAMNLNIVMRIHDDDQDEDANSNYIDITKCELTIGKSVIQARGKYIPNSLDSKKDKLDFVITTINAIDTRTVLSMLDPSISTDGTNGTFKGTIAMSGQADHLLTHADLAIKNVSIPELKIVDLNGKIETPQWTIFNMNSFLTADSTSQTKLDFQSGSIAGLNVKDMHANIIFENKQVPQILLKDAHATISGGEIHMDGRYIPSTKESSITISMKKLQIDQFLLDLMEQSSAVTGLADAEMTFNSRGTNIKDFLSNLNGSGEFSIYRGLMGSFGKLQEKLIHANLLQQGLLGFNVNNLLQSVLPVKTGRFNEVTGYFDVKNGIASIDQLRFDGNDIRLRAAGNLDLKGNFIDLDVAGYIPRVSSSIIPGPFGEVSKRFTVQKFLHTITFRQLESLPSFPILGEIASDNPRAFTFRIFAPPTNTNLIGQSIEKTFRWLPNKPNASAHPLPGQKLSNSIN
jgi:hypothetical protein